jgi:hypothetical protein
VQKEKIARRQCLTALIDAQYILSMRQRSTFMESHNDPPACPEAEQYDLEVFSKRDERWTITIAPDGLAFLRNDAGESARFDRPSAERSIKMATIQIGGHAFSATLHPNRLFKCTGEAYGKLEKWFGYDALLRMEFSGQWLTSFLLGAFLIYHAQRGIGHLGPTLWLMLTALSGLGFLMLGALSKFRSSHSLHLGYAGTWCLLGIRSIYGLMFGIQWLDVLFLFLAVWTTKWHFNRYSRLSRLRAVAVQTDERQTGVKAARE